MGNTGKGAAMTNEGNPHAYCVETITRLERYEKECAKAALTLQSVLPIGQVKAIGLLEVAAGVKVLADDLKRSDAAAAEQLRAVMEANESLRKQLSDQASEISLLNAEAEMWQQRAEIAEREVGRVNERLAAAENMIPNANSKHFVGLTNVRPAFQLTTCGWVVYWPANCAIGDAATATPTFYDDWYAAYLAAVAAGWLPNPKEADHE